MCNFLYVYRQKSRVIAGFVEFVYTSRLLTDSLGRLQVACKPVIREVVPNTSRQPQKRVKHNVSACSPYRDLMICPQMETKSHSLIFSDRLSLASNWKYWRIPRATLKLPFQDFFTHMWVQAFLFLGLLYHASTHIYYVFQHIMDNRVIWKIQL